MTRPDGWLLRSRDGALLRDDTGSDVWFHEDRMREAAARHDAMPIELYLRMRGSVTVGEPGVPAVLMTEELLARIYEQMRDCPHCRGMPTLIELRGILE